MIAILIAFAALAAADPQTAVAGDCAQNVCPTTPLQFSPEHLFFQDKVTRLACLAANHDKLSESCVLASHASVSEFLPQGDKSECQKELDKRCKNSINKWKNAIKDFHVKDAAQAADDVLNCLAKNREAIWDKCKPQPKQSQRCTTEVDAKCSVELIDSQLETMEEKMTCLNEKSEEMSTECVLAANDHVGVKLDTLEAECRDELNKRCKNSIKEWKKAVKNLDVKGTVEASKNVVNCIAKNRDEISEKCKPKPKTQPRCLKEMEQVCPTTQAVINAGSESPEMDHAMEALMCLNAHADVLSQECVVEMSEQLDYDLFLADSKCQKELNKRCKNTIKKWKKAFKSFKVKDFIPTTQDVVNCIAKNRDAIWDKCKPKKNVMVASSFACEERTQEVCPYSAHKALGLGYSLACIKDNADFLGDECAKQGIFAAVDAMDGNVDQACRLAMRSECGKHIDFLQTNDLSANDIVHSAAKVAECIGANAERLWDICSTTKQAAEEEPLIAIEEDEVQTVPQLTLVQEEVEAFQQVHEIAIVPEVATKLHKPTQKPTRRHVLEELNVISEELIFDNEEDDDEVAVVQQATAVELDMAHCVAVAKHMCAREAEQLKSDATNDLFQSEMGNCVDRNLEKIEAICSASATRKAWMTNGVSQEDVWVPLFAPHEPCKHSAGEVSDLPLCEETHNCRAGRGFSIALSVLGFLLMLVVMKRVYRAATGAPNVDKNHNNAEDEEAGGGKPLLQKA